MGWKGLPGRVVDAAVSGRFLLVTSEALLEELRRVLRYPKVRKPFPNPEAIVNLLRQIAIVVDPTPRLSLLEDDADNRVLEAAEARADVIVTGDRRLLRLGPDFQGVRLLAPKGFLALLERETPEPGA